jgi:VanZ family protein
MSSFAFTKKEKVWLGLALLILLLIFVSSSMTYQQQRLKPQFIHHYLSALEHFTDKLNFYYAGNWHNKNGAGGSSSMTEFVIRKAAHFISYFALAACLYLGGRRTFLLRGEAAGGIWLACLGLAALDEFHQALTGDRTPSIYDVILDGSGAALAIVLIVALSKIKKFCHRSHKV